MKLNEVYLLEWSPSQKVSHKQQVWKTVQDNIESIFNGKPGDWIVVGAFATLDECVEAQRVFEAAIKKANQPHPPTTPDANKEA